MKSKIRNKKGLLKIIRASVPKLLIDESEMLKEDFNILNKIYISNINKTGRGYYTLSCAMVIRRKSDVIKFYKNIGFIMKRKQERLGQWLIEKGFIV